MGNEKQPIVQLANPPAAPPSSTPVMPPITNVTMKPIDHRIGTVNRMRPPYIVKSQLKTFTPVGTAMIIVMIPKKPLTSAPAPMVKK